MRSLTAAPSALPPDERSSLWARPLLTGHRGAAAYARGNSLASFTLAVEMGADVLECDVRATADGTLVLLHDAIVGSGTRALRVARATEAQVRARMPDLLTLAELLPFVRAHGMLLNVDLKSLDAEVPIAAMLAAHDLLDRTVITARAPYQLRRFRALAPALRLGLSKGSSPPPPPRGTAEWTALHTQRRLMPHTLPGILRRAHADAAYLHYRLITSHLVTALHREGFGVYAWTVDAPEQAARLREWGVDGITTNRPDRIRPLIPRGAGNAE